MKRFGIYVHVPYCLKQCAYCDFFTMPMVRPRQEHFSPYMTALLTDIRESMKEFHGREISTVFFGGGTPSLLSPLEMKTILQALQEHNSFSKDVEITLEINPESIDLEKAQKMREVGVNRASMGVQSLFREDLKLLGRLHQPESAESCYQDLRKAGFDNISLDFIYGRPSQKLQAWHEELQQILQWAPEHLSLYELILEPGTAMTRSVQRGELVLPEEEIRLEMYRLARRVLQGAGYEWYETSNYCKPGKEARHNLENWMGAEYLGVGPGAHSFKDKPGFGARRANPRNLPLYFERPAGAPWHERDALDARTEALMNGLRIRKGLSLRSVSEDYPFDLLDELSHLAPALCDAGYLEVQGEVWRLTERGAELSDSVLSYLLPELEKQSSS